MKIKIDKVQLQRIHLKAGEVLSVTVKSDVGIEPHELSELNEMLKKTFPNNKIMVFSLNQNNDIKFEAIKTEDVPVDGPISVYSKPKAQNYCDDCSCGKKEAQNGT